MANINLNLLKALNALLTEQSVSKAGTKMGVTQSAMSITLAQLRIIYKDDLLVRGPQGRMQLTRFASQLSASVRQAIIQVDSVFNGHFPFEAANSDRTFHIGMSDYIAFVLLPKLMQTLTHIAPNIKIVQHAVNHMDSLKPFDDLNMDAVIGDFQSVPQSLKTTQLFTDQSVIVADKNHPAFKTNKLAIKKILEYPQIFVALEGQPEQNFIAEMLRDMGHQVKISLITPHTLIALQTLPKTQFITNTVTQLAKPFLASLGLAMKVPPYKLRGYQAKLYWHAREHNDKGHQWLRALIKDTAKNL